MKKILIIGGGAIGLFSAYYLKKKGHDVTIADRNDFTNGCSFGNAGFVVPSHIVPLASPGYVASGIKMMLDPKAPLAFKFPPSMDLIQWASRFYFTATKSHVESSIPVLKELCLYSQSLYKDLYKTNDIGFKLKEEGLLMLYKSKEIEKDEIKGAHLANKHGIEAKILSAAEVQDLERDIELNVLGGILYPGDNHLNANELITFLVEHLKKQGVSFVSNSFVKSIGIKDNRAIEVITDNDKLVFDDLIISSGAWSGKLLRDINIKIDLQPGKGYSFKIKTDKNIFHPALLTDARVAVSPMEEGIVRISGGMEIGYFNTHINKKRLEQIRKSITQFYPEIQNVEISYNNVWQGHRPCSFDGLPFIGKVSRYKNVYVATGHSMLGITLAPATGKLITEMISEENPSIDLKPFRVER